MLKLYVPDGTKKQIHEQYNEIKIKNNLKISKYHDATFIIDHERPAYGAVDVNNNFIPDSAFYRYKSAPAIPKIPHRQTKNYIDADAIYCGGGSFFHFGHFLTEGMSRSWPHDDPKYAHMKYVFYTDDKMPSWAKALLNISGIQDEQILTINQSTRFRSLYVPQQSHVICNFASKQFAQHFANIAKNVSPEKYDKIYLSRMAMGAKKVFGEDTVQRIFEKNGFKIICPEKLPVAKQIALMRNCKILAGCAGTALHLAAFMPRGGTVIQLKRNLCGGNEIEQQIINKAVGLDFILIHASIETQPSSHFTDAPQIIGVTEYLKQFLDDYNFKYTDTDIKNNNNTLQDYQMALSAYNNEKKSTIRKIKKAVIRLASCWWPTKRLRASIRTKLEHILNYKKLY